MEKSQGCSYKLNLSWSWVYPRLDTIFLFISSMANFFLLTGVFSPPGPVFSLWSWYYSHSFPSGNSAFTMYQHVVWCFYFELPEICYVFSLKTFSSDNILVSRTFCVDKKCQRQWIVCSKCQELLALLFVCSMLIKVAEHSVRALCGFHCMMWGSARSLVKKNQSWRQYSDHFICSLLVYNWLQSA